MLEANTNYGKLQPEGLQLDRHIEKKTRKWEVSLIVDNATVPPLKPELA